MTRVTTNEINVSVDAFIFCDYSDANGDCKKLRQKLENIGPQVIKTVWGVGYKFDDEGND